MKYNITYILPHWGEEYLPFQYEFIKANYGGQYIYTGKEENLSKEIKKILLPGVINISFWADLLNPNIHRIINELGIKQIFIEHGCGPKKWFTAPSSEIRLEGLKYFEQLWPTTPMAEEEYKRAGRVFEKKIKKIGYLKNLQYFNNQEEIKSNKNQIYLCPSYWLDWGETPLAIEILHRLTEKYTCYVSIHPSAYKIYMNKLKDIFNHKKNIILLENSADKIEKLKTSEIVIGGNGTPIAEALFMKKKIILIKGDCYTWNKIKLEQIPSHHFANIIDDAIKMSDISELEYSLKKAKYPASGKSLFYKTNFSREKTIKLINTYLEEIKEKK